MSEFQDQSNIQPCWLRIKRRGPSQRNQSRPDQLGLEMAYAAAAFGVVFLPLILAIAIFIPAPTQFQYQVFRITLALAAAGVAAMIPGVVFS